MQHIIDTPCQHVAASLAFWFGLWLLMPGETYQATAAYSMLSQIVSENVLGGIFLFIGIWQGLAVWFSWRRCAMSAALSAVLVWSLISYSFWLASPLSTASITYPHVVLLNAVVFLRLRAE